MNKTILIGNIAKDLELKYSASGVAMCKFSLAVNRAVKKEGQPECDFIQVLCFNKVAENLVNYQTKGSKIAVEGSISTGSYEGQDGKRVYTFEVVAQNIQFLSTKQQQPGQAPQQQQQPPQNNYQQMNQPQYNQNYQPQQMPPQAPPGYTQQQNFGHQAPQYGQAPQQQQIEEDDLPF